MAWLGLVMGRPPADTQQAALLLGNDRCAWLISRGSANGGVKKSLLCCAAARRLEEYARPCWAGQCSEAYRYAWCGLGCAGAHADLASSCDEIVLVVQMASSDAGCVLWVGSLASSVTQREVEDFFKRLVPGGGPTHIWALQALAGGVPHPVWGEVGQCGPGLPCNLAPLLAQHRPARPPCHPPPCRRPA